MSFDFEERLSDSPLSENIWCPQNRCAGDFLSVAASRWEMAVSRTFCAGLRSLGGYPDILT